MKLLSQKPDLWPLSSRVESEIWSHISSLLHVSFSACVQADSTKHRSRKPACHGFSSHETEKCCNKEFLVVVLEILHALWPVSAEKTPQVYIFPV